MLARALAENREYDNGLDAATIALGGSEILVVVARIKLPSASRTAGAVLVRLATTVVSSASVSELLQI